MVVAPISESQTFERLNTIDVMESENPYTETESLT
jgi:hypothetical protein